MTAHALQEEDRAEGMPGVLEPAPTADEVADELAARYHGFPELLVVTTDGGLAGHSLVILALHAWDLEQWRRWCDDLRVDPDSVCSRDYAVVADGCVSGVPVRVIGHGVPALLPPGALPPWRGQGT